jgi:hypothetical protein
MFLGRSTPNSLTGALLGLAFSAAIAAAQERPTRLDLWDIPFGANASEIPDEFVNYACGTGGGPPGLALDHFSDFRTCPENEQGLYEVYFEYDDELEYWARAMQLEIETRIYRGTQLLDYPVVLSLLFDGEGVMRGWRAVTDPRQTFRDREDFWTLGNFVKQKFDRNGWNCVDLPRADGENPAGSYFVKDRCEKTVDGRHHMYERHYYQKKGQTFVDPNTGEIHTDYFESRTLVEVIDAEFV